MNHGRPESDWDLSSKAMTWPTPRAGDGDKISAGVQRNDSLAQVSKMWPTPKAMSGGANSQRASRNAGGPDLQEMAHSWPTPAARDYRAPNSLDSQTKRNTGTRRGQQLPNFVEHGFRSSPQAQLPTSGQTSSPSTRRLNPRFVEFLIGWPIGWTDCDCAGTGYHLWLERSRIELSALLSRPAMEANGQLMLFADGGGA